MDRLRRLIRRSTPARLAVISDAASREADAAVRAAFEVRAARIEARLAALDIAVDMAASRAARERHARPGQERGARPRESAT